LTSGRALTAGEIAQEAGIGATSASGRPAQLPQDRCSPSSSMSAPLLPAGWLRCRCGPSLRYANVRVVLVTAPADVLANALCGPWPRHGRRG